MGLMQGDLRGDPTVALAFERRTYKCSVCPQISQRLVFCRPKLPISNLPVVTSPPQPKAVRLQERVPNWIKAVEELRKRRTAQTAAAKSLAWAKVAEKVRSRQRALKEQLAQRTRPITSTATHPLHGDQECWCGPTQRSREPGVSRVGSLRGCRAAVKFFLERSVPGLTPTLETQRS